MIQFSEQFSHVAAALLGVQREVQPVVKDRENPLHKNRYATLDAVTDYVRPLLAKNDLVSLQSVTDSTYHPTTGVLASFAVETMLLHTTGEWVRNRVVIAVAEIGKEERRTTPQTSGSALTYGRRYSLCAILSLTTDEDDDGNGNTRQRKGARAQSKGSADLNARKVTNYGDAPFPAMNGHEQYSGKPMKDVPTDVLTFAYEKATLRGTKAAQKIAHAIGEVLEDRRGAA